MTVYVVSKLDLYFQAKAHALSYGDFQESGCYSDSNNWVCTCNKIMLEVRPVTRDPNPMKNSVLIDLALISVSTF